MEEMRFLFQGFLKKIRKHRTPGLRFWVFEADKKACGLKEGGEVLFQFLHFVEEFAVYLFKKEDWREKFSDLRRLGREDGLRGGCEELSEVLFLVGSREGRRC